MENLGLAGCAQGPGGQRQVLLVDVETLREMHLAPGLIRENIMSEGIAVIALGWAEIAGGRGGGK
jgi:hypothetical protein